MASVLKWMSYCLANLEYFSSWYTCTFYLHCLKDQQCLFSAISQLEHMYIVSYFKTTSIHMYMRLCRIVILCISHLIARSSSEQLWIKCLSCNLLYHHYWFGSGSFLFRTGFLLVADYYFKYPKTFNSLTRA